LLCNIAWGQGWSFPQKFLYCWELFSYPLFCFVLFCHVKLRIVVSMSVKNCVEILIKIVLNLQIA
jgi:hypothetical protein